MSSIIFDMDGVIFDTESLMFNCWRKVAKEYDIPDMETLYPKSIGTDKRATMQLFEGYYGEAFPLKEIQQKVLSIFQEEIEGKGPPLKPFVIQLLSALKENGWKTALASGTYTEQVKRELFLSEIDKYFDIVIGGDMVEKSKPSPDIFLLACQKLNCIPSDTFVIEDSPNGINAAFSAGTKPIMVPDLIQPTVEIQERCYKICSNLQEAANLLL